MVALKSPLLDLDMDDRTARYVANLERFLVALQINDVKFRALLELVTGEEWDDMVTDFEAGNLRKIAEEALIAKGMRPTEASKLVRQRMNQASDTSVVTDLVSTPEESITVD